MTLFTSRQFVTLDHVNSKYMKVEDAILTTTTIWLQTSKRQMVLLNKWKRTVQSKDLTRTLNNYICAKSSELQKILNSQYARHIQKMTCFGCPKSLTITIIWQRQIVWVNYQYSISWSSCRQNSKLTLKHFFFF